MSHEQVMNDFLGISNPDSENQLENSGQDPADPTEQDGEQGKPKNSSNTPPSTEGDDKKNDNKKPAENTPEPDYGSYLTTISEGAVKSEDDFRAILGSAGKVSVLESQITELTGQLDSLKNANPFANEYVKRLNELYASGADPSKIKAFNRINQLGDINELSSQDALIYDLQEQHNLTKEEAMKVIANKYKTDETKFDEDEIDLARIQMKMDADNAKARLQEKYKASFETEVKQEEPKETPEQIEQKKQEFFKKITPIAQSIEQNLPNYFNSVNVNGKQGDEAVSISLPVPPEVASGVREEVVKFAMNSGIDGTSPEGKADLEAYAQNITKIIMFDAWAIDISNKREEAIREEFHNPATIDRGKDNPATPEENSYAAVASQIASGI